ncbi:ATP-binding cassette domain-containing protein [Ramlibacter sp. RBP-2]|uniref:ATP-binding cassette domain-containing protein n=1 Tax=Ramlibacter lithotrophicus TaxID=2606681 RepID=A0A7X6DE59_9BURK|nr:ATP-binding cassette domain-containing protein [Ramlibacter lithotrophicus]NKE65506.1 ATP-binding cassette domain-containing protein [Ramlibacter lithotrophicus]
MSLLTIEGLLRRFGGVAAVDDVSFDLREGEILGLIGPNGSGKTTVLNMLSGFLAPHAGRVRMRGEDITGLPPDRLAQRGVLRMFQMTRVFARMSAFDNLLTAGMARGLSEAESTKRAQALVEELTLGPVQYLDAGQLSGGQRKLLEFGMCFIEPPLIAMLDEPFAAVHPVMREVMAKFIRTRHAQGFTFLLVSHDMPIVVDLCQRAVCMNAGRVIAAGDIHAVLKNHAVIEAYLGESQHGEGEPPSLEVHS